MSTMTFTIEGDVNVEVTITEVDGGNLQFDVTVLDGTYTGDLQGLFFDLADDSLADGLSVVGTDATDSQFEANDVTNLGQGVNINGEVLNEYGEFDAGVQIGTQGISKDDIQTTTFVISHDTEALTLADVALQDFAVRLTSVGEVDGARNDSLKLGGTAPDVEEPPAPENVAVLDTLTVGNLDNFDDGGDLLDGGADTILFNDTTGTDPYLSDVAAVNGDAANIGAVVTGSNGGLMVIDADGTVNFSANGEFGYLGLRDSATTEFSYAIDGGAEALVIVTVTGYNDVGG
ncbi:hypothetical protein [Flavimaricola marinus]|uniref:RapA2 cadherin-like domain-containing protein n=1 Tax=Flavimaricola marinus TaxID=1819565 RepID=A0A238LE17_9RHOB|nr:hypothetical protein [Flavimaricola marinus]SMY07957.1 hypothetical protein LOM8899_02102 [Flavimaricola marinus]